MQHILIVTNPESIDGPESEVGKPIKKATSSKSSKSRPQETKAPPKRTKKPRGTSVVDESVVDTPTEKTSKRTVDASEKRTLNVSTKKTIPNADDDIEDDVPVVKSKAKGKAVNKMNSKGKSLARLSVINAEGVLAFDYQR